MTPLAYKEYQTLLFDDMQHIPRIFGKDDIAKILNVIMRSKKLYLKNCWGDWMRHRDKCIMFTIYYCALRPKECCKLLFSDFDLKNGLIFIRGENNKQRKDRVLPIPKALLPHYEEYFKFPKLQFWKGSPYLFPSYMNAYISPERWKHRFREILKEAKIWRPSSSRSKVPPYRSYTLRATAATEMLELINNPFVVARFLGHSDLRAIKPYLHMTQRMIEGLKNAVNLRN